MNAIQYAVAAAVLALSAHVSAQIVYIPDFPAPKTVEPQTVVETTTATQDAEATKKAA